MGDAATLDALTVDELVIQSYQGRYTMTNYQTYLPTLSRLRIPLRLGLMQNGSRNPLTGAQFEKPPWYHGTVVFMPNPSRH